METIYNWTARRAGGRITINGTSADATDSPPRKVPNVDVIRPTDCGVVAIDKNGVSYSLRGPNALRPPPSPQVARLPTVHVVKDHREREIFERRLAEEGKTNTRVIAVDQSIGAFRERCAALEPGDIHIWTPILDDYARELRIRQRHGGDFIFH